MPHVDLVHALVAGKGPGELADSTWVLVSPKTFDTWMSVQIFDAEMVNLVPNHTLNLFTLSQVATVKG